MYCTDTYKICQSWFFRHPYPTLLYKYILRITKCIFKIFLADNMLLSFKTGKSIAIDFGYSFGSTYSLPIPEIAPFRFTPQIQRLMYPFKNHGIFKDTMIKAFQQMKSNQDVLLCALALFINEPTLDWSKNSNQKCGDLAQHRINIVKDKMNLNNPVTIINSEMSKFYRNDHISTKNGTFLKN